MWLCLAILFAMNIFMFLKVFGFFPEHEEDVVEDGGSSGDENGDEHDSCSDSESDCESGDDGELDLPDLEYYEDNETITTNANENLQNENGGNNRGNDDAVIKIKVE